MGCPERSADHERGFGQHAHRAVDAGHFHGLIAVAQGELVNKGGDVEAGGTEGLAGGDAIAGMVQPEVEIARSNRTPSAATASMCGVDPDRSP